MLRCAPPLNRLDYRTPSPPHRHRPSRRICGPIILVFPTFSSIPSFLVMQASSLVATAAAQRARRAVKQSPLD